MSSGNLPGAFQHKARKRFGQNFLEDEGIIRAIIRGINLQADDHVVEIGPGKGAITQHIVDQCARLDVIELDRDLVPVLLAQFAVKAHFKLHQHDALRFDFAALRQDSKLRIVGNLPYNISTPLIFYLLDRREHIADMHFMLQKEVVLRLAAPPSHKNYGRLSVMAQYFCEVSQMLEVPPESFHPAPKVDSGVVRLVPYVKLPYIAENFSLFEALVKGAFSQRRKTMRNALKNFVQEQNDIELSSLDFDFSRRAESVSVAEYVALANQITSL